MNNNNNQQKKKYYQRAWFWMLMVLILSFAGAITYNLALGGKAGIQHHRIIMRYNRRVHQTDKVAGDKANFKIDSLETVRAKLKRRLGVSNLKKVPYSKIDSTLHQLYGDKQVDLIEQGLLVSVNMTPGQQADMATEIAAAVHDPNLVVGLSKHYITSDILTGKYTSKPTAVNLVSSNEITVLQSNETEAWQKVKGHSVSSPQIANLPTNWIRTHIPDNLRGNGRMTGVVWVKAEDGDRMRDIENVALALHFKVLNNDATAQLLNTSQKEQSIYREFTLLNAIHPFSKNYQNLKVLSGSYIPVVFSVKSFELPSNQKVNTTLDGQSYTLSLYTDKNGTPYGSLTIPK